MYYYNEMLLNFIEIPKFFFRHSLVKHYIIIQNGSPSKLTLFLSLNTTFILKITILIPRYKYFKTIFSYT